MIHLFKYNHSDNWYYSFTVNGKRYRKSTKSVMKTAARRIAQDAYNRAQLPSSESSAMLLNKYIDLYVQSLQDTGKTKNTIRTYKNALTNFSHYTGNIPINEIDQAHLESYKMTRKSKLLEQNGSDNIKASYTINTEIRSIKAAFYTAVRLDLLKYNPVKGIKQYKIPRVQDRIYLNKEEITKLLTYVNNDIQDSMIGKLIKLLLFTGCRLSSAVSLIWDRVDFSENTITFLNKPGGTYKIPINNDAKLLLDELNQNNVYVIAKNKTEGYTVNWGSVAIKRIFKQLNFPSQFTTHHLRHTFASHLVMNGVHLKIIAELLGQSYERTALIYSHVDTTSLDKASNLLNFESLSK